MPSIKPLLSDNFPPLRGSKIAAKLSFVCNIGDESEDV